MYYLLNDNNWSVCPRKVGGQLNWANKRLGVSVSQKQGGFKCQPSFVSITSAALSHRLVALLQAILTQVRTLKSRSYFVPKA
jgi:hypothetical protein